jgi:hypothetical protein
MSYCKHTLGPWEKKHHSLCVQTFSEPKIKICYTDTFGTSSVEADANARLMAAAPEMAAMLMWMFVSVSHGGPTRSDAEALLKKAGVLE